MKPTILFLIAFALVSGVNAADLRVVDGWPQLPDGETLGEVCGVASDSHGNVFVFHRGHRHRPWRDDLTKPAASLPEPAIDVFDGGTGKLLAHWGENTFLLPHGLFIDSDNHVWLTDVGWHQVFEFTGEGKLLQVWGERRVPGEDASHFNKPTDVAVAPDRSFYVSDGYGNNRVAKFSAEGKFLFQWGTKGTGPGEFNLPHGIALDKEGRVYVADRENDRVQVFAPDGKFLTQWKGPQIGRPYGIRVGLDGLVYIADGGELSQTPPDRSKVVVLNRAGTLIASFGRWGNYNGQFMIAHDLGIASNGTVYVGDIDGHRVQKLEWVGSRP
jgi:peptidylamidoglycolate lyase